MTMFAIARMIATSSNIRWVLPVMPASSPAYPPVILTGSLGWAMSTRMESSARATAKQAKVEHERDRTRRGHPGRDPEQVLLGDAHLEEAIGVGLLEDVGPGRAPEVAVEHHDAGVGLAEFGDRLAPGEPEGLALRGAS